MASSDLLVSIKGLWCRFVGHDVVGGVIGWHPIPEGSHVRVTIEVVSDGAR